MEKRSILRLALFVALGCFSGCLAHDGGEGTVQVELWGEDFIESGIPSAEFADGFSVHFDTFLVNLGGISLVSQGTASELVMPEMKVWDLTEKGPFPLLSTIFPAGEIESVSYSIARATSSSQRGNVSAEVRDLMVAGGYSVYVIGTAASGEESIEFEWGFEADTDYGPCHGDRQLKDGAEVTLQITIHGDHLFYDDAIVDSPSLRFYDIALADGDEDGAVSKTELVDYDINILPHYGAGNLDIDNLWEFISQMATTLGHINGEGHCD